MKQKIIDILSGLQTDGFINNYIFEDFPTSNVRLDSRGNCVGVLYQFIDFDLDFSTGLLKESAEINISFLIKDRKLDSSGEEEYDIISEAKQIMLEFIRRVRELKEYTIVEKTLNIRSVFLTTDSNRTGVNCVFKLKQRQGECF